MLPGRPAGTGNGALAGAAAGLVRHRSLSGLEHLGDARKWLHAAWSREIDRRRLFLFLPVFFALGIMAYFAAEIEPSAVAPALGMVLCAIGTWALRRHYAALAAFLALSAMFGGFLAGTIRTRHVAAPILVQPVIATLDATIETLDWTPYGVRAVLRLIDMAPAVEVMPERVRVTLRGRPALVSGETIRVKARLSPPQGASVPGGFDFRREAYFQRLGAVGFALGAPEQMERQEAPMRSRLVALVDRARNSLTERIISVVGGSTGAISAALVTGKRGLIPEAENDNLRAAGIYHIVSISGLHMVLAAGLFFWIARIVLVSIPGLALRHPVKKWAAVVAMFGAIAYDVFSGSEVATERSLIMTLVMFGAILFDRPAIAMRNLALAGLIILALEPETLAGPSFQMSFAAVAALVAFGEFEKERKARRQMHVDTFLSRLTGKAGYAIFAVIATTIIAGLATAPFQAYHFHRLNPYGVLGNALAIPLCSFVVMPSALVGVALLPFGIDAPVWWIMGQGVSGIQTFAAWVANINGSVAATARFGLGPLLIMAAGLAVAVVFTEIRFRLAGLGIMVLGMANAGHTARPDLILDPTGTHALVRGADGRLALLGTKRPTFALQQWLPGDRDLRHPRDASLTASVVCDKSACISRLPDGRAVSLVLTDDAFAMDCERAAVVVTSLDAPESCRKTATVFDRTHFQTYGATYIYADNRGWRTETARNERVDRPWSPRPGRPNTAQVSPATSEQNPASAPGMPWDRAAPDATTDQ